MNPRSQPWLLPLLALVASASCTREDAGAESSADASSAAPPATAEAGEPGPTLDPSEADTTPAAPTLSIDTTPLPPALRAEAPATVSAKGTKSMGFAVARISHLFAFAAEPQQAEWAAGEGAPALTRDDDLDSAWTCELGGERPCALSFVLPEPGRVEALRLYTAAGPRYRVYKGNPRVRGLRIHSDQGYLDAELPDGANHVYVRFAEPVLTQTLSVEILSSYPGKGKGEEQAPVRIAELEIYGTEGVPRPPIQLDPSLAWVSWETGPWSGGPEEHTIRHVFLQVGVPAAPPAGGLVGHRFMRATGVFGQAGDDYLLIERLHGASCEATRGNYMLYDTRSRMLYALGELGGAGTQVFRHRSGRGFAVGWALDGDNFTVKGIVEEAGVLTWKRPPKPSPASASAQLDEWGFEPTPLQRGHAPSQPTPGCELRPAAAVAGLDRRKIPDADQGEWLLCALEGQTIAAKASCGGRAAAMQRVKGRSELSYLGDEGEARGLRVRSGDGRLFVELSSEGGDSSTLFLAEGEAFVELEAQGGLFVRPPASCSPCEDSWPSPLPPPVPELP